MGASPRAGAVNQHSVCKLEPSLALKPLSPLLPKVPEAPVFSCSWQEDDRNCGAELPSPVPDRADQHRLRNTHAPTHQQEQPAPPIHPHLAVVGCMAPGKGSEQGLLPHLSLWSSCQSLRQASPSPNIRIVCSRSQQSYQQGSSAMEGSGMGIQVHLMPKTTASPPRNMLGFLSFPTGSS